MKRLVCILVVLLMLCPQVFAKGPSLTSQIQTFMQEKGLDDTNFSVCVYNNVTQESISINENLFAPVGKLWTLPLHMYFYEQMEMGAFEPTKENPEPVTIQGMTVEDALYRSLILSEDGVSEKLRAHIGSPMQYHDLINSLYGKQNKDILPPEYWNGGVLSTGFLMNCLRTVSVRPEQFGNMMTNYFSIQKADGFIGSGSPPYTVQVRGESGDYIAAAAEVSAAQPFLIAAIIKNVTDGDEILAELNGLICAYVAEAAGEQPQGNTEPSTQRNSSNYYIGEERMSGNDTLSQWLIIAFGIAAGVAVVLAVVFLIIRARQRKKHGH